MIHFALFTKGGFLVYIIFICSLFALGSFLERMVTLRKCKINTDALLKEVERLITENNMADALALCKRLDSPISRVVEEGILYFHYPREQISEKLDAAILKELPLLEAHLGVLSTVAHVTPLLGLLGTVNGMIKAFQIIQAKAQETGLASPTDLAQGIWEALITTALGLSVAIPTIMAYNYLHHKVLGIKNDMERAASHMLSLVVS